MTTLAPAALKVQTALRKAGSAAKVVEMPASTRTAEEAALACGVAVGAIVKSLVFRGETTGEAILILTSGANRVNEGLAAKALGERISRPDAGFVRDATGFAIGGVPPLGHARPMRVVLDRDLARYPVIWAAAGTPNTVFPTSAEELQRLTGAKTIEVA